MKYVLSLVSILLFFSADNCCAQQSVETNKLRITDFRFQSIFGTKKDGANTIYCLLGSGFFRTPRSENADAVIAEWLLNHSDAFIIPVSSFKSGKNENMIYCWIVQGTDTLNNYLIRNGCFPGGTMVRPKTWEEMESRERELFTDANEKPDVKVFIDQKVYELFIEQVKSAELYAREHKLGTWEKEEEK